jgi:hypothetical protein
MPDGLLCLDYHPQSLALLFDDARDIDVNARRQKLFLLQIHTDRCFAEQVTRLKEKKAIASASYEVLYGRSKK